MRSVFGVEQFGTTGKGDFLPVSYLGSLEQDGRAAVPNAQQWKDYQKMQEKKD